MMELWKIQMVFRKETIGEINIKTGILQGDSLSPLLFVLSIDLISKELNKALRPICITREGKSFELSHTFYMDDLKIIIKEMYEMVRADTIMKYVIHYI